MPQRWSLWSRKPGYNSLHHWSGLHLQPARRWRGSLFYKDGLHQNRGSPGCSDQRQTECSNSSCQRMRFHSLQRKRNTHHWLTVQNFHIDTRRKRNCYPVGRPGHRTHPPNRCLPNCPGDGIGSYPARGFIGSGFWKVAR